MVVSPSVLWMRTRAGVRVLVVCEDAAGGKQQQRRLVTHNSETSNALSKHVGICDAEIWTEGHFANRDLATNERLAEQDEAEVNRHDDLLSELLRNLVYDGVVVLLVSLRIDAYQCSKIISTQLWIDGIELSHAFEWRFEQSRGTTESSKVVAHDESNVSKRAIGREIEAKRTRRNQRVLPTRTNVKNFTS